MLSRITPSPTTRARTSARVKVSAHAALSVGGATIVLLALSQWFGWHLTREQTAVAIGVIVALSAQLSPYISLPLSLESYVTEIGPYQPSADDGHLPKPAAWQTQALPASVDQITGTAALLNADGQPLTETVP